MCAPTMFTAQPRHAGRAVAGSSYYCSPSLFQALAAHPALSPPPTPQLVEAHSEVKRLNKLMAALDAAGRGDTSAFLADDPGEAGGPGGLARAAGLLARVARVAGAPGLCLQQLIADAR